jgi:hypothetical protein
MTSTNNPYVNDIYFDNTVDAVTFPNFSQQVASYYNTLNNPYDAIVGNVNAAGQLINPNGPFAGSMLQGYGPVAACWPNSQSSNSMMEANIFSAFLSQYSPSNPLPSTWQGFLSAWTSFASAHNNIVDSTGASMGSYGGDNGALYQALLFNFEQLQGINPTNGGDWSVLLASQHLSDPNDPNNPFILAFNSFLQNYPYNNSAIGPNGLTGNVATNDTAYSNFASQFATFFATTNPLQDSSASNFPVSNLPPSYETIFRLYGPSYSNPTDFQAAFQTELNSFYNDMVVTKGYFTPAQDFNQWVTTVRTLTGVQSGSPLDANDASKALILNRLIALLIALVGTLQRVGVAQAARLQLTTEMQNVYTNMETQIPTFVKGDTGPLGSINPGHGIQASTQAQDRNTLNASFNSILSQNLQSLRGVQEDRAKQYQSDVNQTNDMVNQQTDMATSFIQQLNSLLSNIFR